MKIGDFGLARRLPDGLPYYESTDSEEIAVRWTAVESIVDGRFTVASDIWSFAVTTWEVFSFAARPYGDLVSTAEVVKRVVSGRILDRPDGTPDVVYELMKSCWTLDPGLRPCFDELSRSLSAVRCQLKHICS